MWQVNFSSDLAPTETGSLSTPENFSFEELVLLPTHFKFAFICNEEVLVWDAQHHKFLLHSTDVESPRAMCFSSNGHFFACGTKDREFHIWKKSPTGYLPHQKFVSYFGKTTPLISPNGEIVISSNSGALQLLHTTSSAISPPSISTQTFQSDEWLFVEFSPDKSLVAVTRRLSSIVTVLGIKSGNPWFVIDTDTKNCGLRVTEDKVIVVGDGKIVTWDISVRDSTSTTGRDITNSVQTTTFKHSTSITSLFASISPDLNYVAFGTQQAGTSEDLSIYNMHTGEKLAVAISDGVLVGFTPSGHEVWCAIESGEVDRWEIIQKNGSHGIELKKLKEDVEPQGLLWLSPHGYKITDDGWILCSSGKLLLWLPNHLKPDVMIQKNWGGKYLAVWNSDSSEPCILELDV
jgi:hypothetical protein